MNVDIINIGHYRITSHGGRLHDLFNRESDKVWTITKEEFSFIKNARTLEACKLVDAVYEGGDVV